MLGDLRDMFWHHHWCMIDYLDPRMIVFSFKKEIGPKIRRIIVVSFSAIQITQKSHLEPIYALFMFSFLSTFNICWPSWRHNRPSWRHYRPSWGQKRPSDGTAKFQNTTPSLHMWYIVLENAIRVAQQSRLAGSKNIAWYNSSDNHILPGSWNYMLGPAWARDGIICARIEFVYLPRWPELIKNGCEIIQ